MVSMKILLADDDGYAGGNLGVALRESFSSEMGSHVM